MLGYRTLRETWETQWGPQPVLALSGTRTGRRVAPVTLPFGGDPFADPGAADRRPDRHGRRGMS